MSPNDTEKNPPAFERRSAADTEKYFNGQFDEMPLYLEPGNIVCSDAEKEMFVATVGSGVLVTMFDTELKIGATAYVLIPDPLLQSFPYFDKADPKWKTMATKPIESCVNEMKRKGAGKHRIQTRIIGGCKMPNQTQDEGTKNSVFVREYLTRKGLGIMNEDVGGPYIRRVHFFPKAGRAVRFMLRRTSDFVAMEALEAKLNFKN